MNSESIKAIEKAMNAVRGQDVRVVEIKSVGGGCISQAFSLRLDDGTRVFAKSNDSADSNLFATEAAGLRALKETNTVRVPQVYGHTTVGRQNLMIMEQIESGRRSKDYFEIFGSQLAKLHQQSAPRYGFQADNFIGATRQPNAWSENWSAFFRDHRLAFQLELANRNGLGGKPLQSLGESLMNRLDDLISTPEPPAMIHGDLWSGNYLCGPESEPVVIDPAVYYADREAEFGMVILFGGVNQAFYRGYNEVYPLRDHAEERFEIYKLYHLLNHLNLFGSSYLPECLSILRKFA